MAVSRALIDAMLDELLGKGEIRAETRPSRGRPATCYYLMEELLLAVAS